MANIQRLSMALFLGVAFTLITTPVAQAGKYLDELQVQDACGTTYAEKLATCTPFKCQKPSPMAMMMVFPSEDEIRKVPPEQEKVMRASMVAAEKKMEAMSEEKRAEMKEKMFATLEIKGRDAQEHCQTSTMGSPTNRMDCVFDAAMLQKISEFTKAAEESNHIKFDTSLNSGNPWQDALQNGQCKAFSKDSDAGWMTMDQMNRMAHIKLNISEHGKPVAGHIRILNAADGTPLFDKDVRTDQRMRKINLEAGTFDIEVKSMNPELAPVWFRGKQISEAHIFKKDVEFYAITGTLKLTVTLDGKPSYAGVYMTDPENEKWVYGNLSMAFGNKARFHFSPTSINLPDSLTGRYEVFVTAVPKKSSLRVPENAKYQKFSLSIKNGETVEKTLDFGKAAGTPSKPEKQAVAKVAKAKFPVTDAHAMEQNTDRSEGPVLRRFITTAANPALCQKACQDDAQCKVWTYVKPNTVEGPSPTCWLKSSISRAHPSDCCTSGVKAAKK